MQNQIDEKLLRNQDISSPAVNPQLAEQPEYNPTYHLEQAIGAQVQKIVQLVQKGVITSQQGQYLMANLARKAQEINNYKNSLAQQVEPMSPETTLSLEPQPEEVPQLSPMELFNQERPGFFDGDGRADILNYIQAYNMDKDEILQIAQLVEKLENSAVEKYLKQSEYERSLNDENAAAKSRLIAYAQKAVPDSNTSRIYTREDIGRMSGEEFTKNEKLIMEQLKQGLIK